MVTNNNELLGQVLGTCTLRRLIGRGGMGSVYLAQQARPRRIVAVKVLIPGTFLDQRPSAEFLMRFRREADAVAALDHVNIMPVYEYGEQGDLAYIVMPYVTGGTLRQLLEKRGALPLEEVVPIIEQAAAALDSAHAQGIIHRDLKPGNILLHADGRVLLADFGLAKMVKDAQEEYESHGQTALTSAGTIIGTPEYLSPEQGTGKPVDYRTDVYSLGVVIFQMLAGRVPFTGPSPVAIAIKHAIEEPPSLSRLNPAIPARVEAVVRKAMAKNPDDRYASAGELARALKEACAEACEQEEGTEQTPARPIETYETLLEVQEPVKLEGPRSDGVQPPAELHNAPTEENPPLPRINTATTAPEPALSSRKTPAMPAAIEHADTILATPREPITPDLPRSKDHAHQQEKLVLEPVHLAQQQTIEPEQFTPVRPPVRPPQKRGGGQPLLMMFFGSFLTLLIVVGGFAAYTHYFIKQPTKPAITNRATPRATTGNGTPQTHKTLPPLPGPAISAGPLLYGAVLPGPECDTQGGKWISTPGAKVVCEAEATRLNNTGASQTAGLFLEAIKGGQPLTNNYIVQVQVRVRPDSQGDFGVFFLTQSGSTPTTFAWMINPSTNSWQAKYYTNASSAANQVLTSGPITNKMNALVTIDVATQGNGTVLYVDGARIGGTAGLGLHSGTFGLAADPGADVSFKNVAVYSLP